MSEVIAVNAKFVNENTVELYSTDLYPRKMMVTKMEALYLAATIISMFTEKDFASKTEAK